MIRNRLSKFLIALADMVGGNAAVKVQAKSVSEDRPSPPVPKKMPEPAEPERTYLSVESSPRMPPVPPADLAMYWQAALDFVSFRELGKKKPTLICRPDEVQRRGASEDEQGQMPTGKNVHVVLTLQEQHRRKQSDKGRRHHLMAVPALLTGDGYLVPRTDAPPVLNGSYLAPDVGPYAFCIAQRDVADDAMTSKLRTMTTDRTMSLGWETWWCTAMSVLRELLEAGSDEAMLARMLELLPPDKGGKPTQWQLIAAVFPTDDGGRGQIAATYEATLQEMRKGEGRVPLFERLGGTEHATDVERIPPEAMSLIMGHIDEYEESSQRRSLFPLDDTQRMAVTAILSLADGELQAINGPPGSGKTSMLRAVVASQWVNAALRQEPCPITLACGATNQSVTNVIEAFGKAPHPDDSLPHAQRWIADASSYGAYLPASSRLSNEELGAENERFVCLQTAFGGGFPYRYWKRADALDPLHALEYEEVYLSHARRALGDESLGTLEVAIKVVWQRLASVEQRLKRFDSEWRSGGNWQDSVNVHLDARETVWASERMEVARDCVKRLTTTPSEENAQKLSDLLWRPDTFHWAARYWEGRFLLAQRERLITRHPLNVEEALRRICMLTPCIVSTLHSAPRLLEIQRDFVDPADPVTHVLGKVDLLVVDEAGQASPELAASIFALARRAAVVGDIKQLAPIWNNTPLTEFGIAAQTDTLAHLDAIVRSRRSVASGSILGVARLLSRWRERNDLGVSLRYHYRCKPNIISYCNTLAYDGQLIARTREDDKGPEPTMAWVAVDATPVPVSGSWSNPREVEEIVSWIVERWPTWRKHPQTENKSLHEIIALITPYRPQADLLKSSLKNAIEHARKKHGGDWPDKEDVEKVVIGTVHKLQGAERPIVCFSLVEGPEQSGTSFIDTERSLLNVAVSRAKRSFIIFANPRRLFSDDLRREVRESPELLGATIASMSPSHQLGAHLHYRISARPLYPQRVVFIEAINKQQTLSDILGKVSAVMATAGALTQLPVNGGVDIGAGFVPYPINESTARDFLNRAARILPSINEVVLATDDDRMGEYISWQISRLLRGELTGKLVVRARLAAMTRSAVSRAIDASTDINERKVTAEIVREIADCLITQRFTGLSASEGVRLACGTLYDKLAPLGAIETDRSPTGHVPSLGRVQAAILGLLLRQARETLELAGSNRIVAEIPYGKGALYGEVFHLAQNRATTQTRDGLSALAGLALAPDTPPMIVRDVAGPPEAGTISIMAQAWRRFGLEPWTTMDALQSLYDGSWSAQGHQSSAPDPYEPEEPVVPLERQGHPPITPLDRTATPDVLAHQFSNPACDQVYRLVWDRLAAAERGPYELRYATLDLPFDSNSAAQICIRVRAASCRPAITAPTFRDDDNAIETATLMLGDDPARINAVDDLLEAWDRRSFDGVIPRLSMEPAGQWEMPLDRLLLDLESAGIGRPSTLARSLQRLVEKKLIVLPAAGGSVKLTKSGVEAALTLEAAEPELSSPDFSSRMSGRLDAIERGEAGPRDVLAWLATYFMPRAAVRELTPRIWNSLAELEFAMDHRTASIPSGGLVSRASNTDSITGREQNT
ncbi:AAA domain-containing protein [Dyella caseinilytica]|uniref:AAA family ATPase n=1 Tax=Dyella caseinilytica TaxID=1849581 RepID=A0ABX7GPQ9_9GAMM|nr:AAA domain-containing protein [Dyella caseinilytica]QRN52230.1 AAA family ATPase [Dyella caseinilytica]